MSRKKKVVEEPVVLPPIDSHEFREFAYNMYMNLFPNAHVVLPQDEQKQEPDSESKDPAKA